MQDLTQKVKPHLRLWIKFKAPTATRPNGTAIHKNSYRNDQERGYYLKRYLRHILKLDKAGKIWQARIYEQPGNSQIYVFKSESQNYDNQNQTED